MKEYYTDGFFKVSPTYGFLPIKAPLSILPAKYEQLQHAIESLPSLINDLSRLSDTIKNLVEYDVSNEQDIFIIQVLFRAYTFLSSAYLLAPAFHNQKNGIYGQALNILPRTLARPLVIVAGKLDVMPWLEYHYAYSLGNYVKIDLNKTLHWSNLKMACSFTGQSDETGFIMNHVYINEKSPDLVKAIYLYLDNQELEGIKLFYTTMLEINARRKTMWQASNHKNYNHFRVFIMGIKGNDEIFGPGVKYLVGDVHDDEYRQYRGQTGAQDDIIPTADIFTNIVEYYPHNQLTAYLLDLRQYRPKCVQEFFSDLQKDMSSKPIKQYFTEHDQSGLVYLLASVEQIYLFRNGHWQFVQKYIMANTKYATATGGTPVISWLPNQIQACLKTMDDLLKIIKQDKLQEPEISTYNNIKLSHASKIKLIDQQLEELRKQNYDFAKIYDFNSENNLEDRS